MRGVVAFIVAILLMTVLLIGGGMVWDGLAPVTEDLVGDHETGATEGGVEHITLIERMMFVVAPLFMLGVVAIWAVVWYLRQDRHRAPIR